MKNNIGQQLKPHDLDRVVHRLPGRLRVRLARLHDDPIYGTDIQRAVTALPGVTEVRIHPAARSIVITYQTSQLSEHAVLDCLGVVLLPIEAHPAGDGLDSSPTSDFVREAEDLSAEITSESIGEVVGETVGEVLMGPIGMAIGAEIGGTIGGHIGESIGSRRSPNTPTIQK